MAEECIVNAKFIMPSFSIFSSELGQEQIFVNQVKKFKQDKLIAILSGIPLFLLAYHKEAFWDEMIND